MTPDTQPTPNRIAIFSRYNLAEQYDLAAEFRGMLQELASRNEVLHLSLRGTRTAEDVPPRVTVQELPLSINRHSPRDMLLKTLLLYLYLPAAACRLRRFKPQLIFLSEIIPMAGLLLQWMTGIGVATAYGDWHFHNMIGRKKWSRPLLRLVEALDRFEARRLRGFFCRAAAAGERVQRWGVPETRVRVVRDAPDPEAFFPRDESELRQRCGFSKDDVVLLYHGVMHSGKGIDKLIAWTHELYAECPLIGLILVGGGPEEKALRQLAASLPIANRVHFTGWLKTLREVGAYICAADISVAMRTATEANDRVVPGALLHSMACEKIVIGPRLSGIAEIIREGDNGFMFDADNGEAFKTLIRRLISERKTWDAVRRNAYRDIMENYSVSAAAKKYAEAIGHFAHGH